MTYDMALKQCILMKKTLLYERQAVGVGLVYGYGNNKM